jgi:hypothetical protein
MAGKTRRYDATTTPTKVNNVPTDTIAGAQITLINPTASGGTIHFGYVSTILAGTGNKGALAPSSGDPDGLPVAAGEVAVIDLQANEDIYVRSASGTVTIYIGEAGV